jgi:hypothetical protein
MAKTEDRAMTEDELLTGITDALTLSGWRWFHVRRSDLAVCQGNQGWPDVFAIHAPRRLSLVMELKAEDGRLSGDQAMWIHELNVAGVNAITIRPGDYDRILDVILGRGPAEQTSIDTPRPIVWDMPERLAKNMPGAKA